MRPRRIDGERRLDERNDVAVGRDVVIVGASGVVWDPKISLEREGGIDVAKASTARPASQPRKTVVGAFGVPVDARPDAHDPAAVDACLQSRRDARVTAANMALSSNVVQENPVGDGTSRAKIRRA